ncbi:hypothetical protein E5288_WYG007825 [Bos mutus]|uniref:Uncharacterized protein n=1 Tax=Bos mutus TaxID=72004 RepID=A0A6B0RG01_9CETA|nr:hypothetical protein [Bos mutus]
MQNSEPEGKAENPQRCRISLGHVLVKNVHLSTLNCHTNGSVVRAVMLRLPHKKIVYAILMPLISGPVLNGPCGKEKFAKRLSPNHWNNGLEQCGFCVVDIRIVERGDHRTKWFIIILKELEI